MAAHTKLMIGAGFAVAGLGLIGAGAGATFTAQVSASTEIRSGGVGLSLNGETGSGLRLDVDGKKISSHFKPISTDLRLKNTGTLDLASTFLSATATGCDGKDGAPLAKALRVRLTEMNHDSGKPLHAEKVIYDGALCSMATTTTGHDFTYPPAHAGVGNQLPRALKAGETISYRLVIQPVDDAEGLPSDAQFTRTRVNVVFTGFDY